MQQGRFNLIHEKEWTAVEPVYSVCKRHGTSRKSYYKWNNRYTEKGIEGFIRYLCKRPYNIEFKKITVEEEEEKETVLYIRLT